MAVHRPMRRRLCPTPRTSISTAARPWSCCSRFRDRPHRRRRRWQGRGLCSWAAVPMSTRRSSGCTIPVAGSPTLRRGNLVVLRADSNTDNAYTPYIYALAPFQSVRTIYLGGSAVNETPATATDLAISPLTILTSPISYFSPGGDQAGALRFVEGLFIDGRRGRPLCARWGRRRHERRLRHSGTVRVRLGGGGCRRRRRRGDRRRSGQSVRIVDFVHARNVDVWQLCLDADDRICIS